MCQIYMTASAWGSWLITAFISWHSAGTVTAKSTWVSCNRYWIGYTLVTQATGRCTDSKQNKHINIQAKTLIFSRGTKNSNTFKHSKIMKPLSVVLYLMVKECRGVRPGWQPSTGWDERSADRVIPEPSRTRAMWSGSSSGVSEAKVMKRSWP